MNVDHGLWGKLTRVVIFLLLVAGLATVAVWYLPLIQQNERMRKDVLRLDGQIQTEIATQRQYRASIEALRYDTNAVERLAREKLRYAKPGEIIVTFENPTNSAGR